MAEGGLGELVPYRMQVKDPMRGFFDIVGSETPTRGAPQWH